MTKWIVHPHSYVEGGRRAISVIHESYLHGMRSYGWYNSDKIFIATDSVYGIIEEGACKVLIKYAEDMAKKLNADNIQPNPDVLKETERLEKEEKLLGERFAKDFIRIANKSFGKFRDNDFSENMPHD